MLAISRALLLNPQLIMDEPTEGLAPGHRLSGRGHAGAAEPKRASNRSILVIEQNIGVADRDLRHGRDHGQRPGQPHGARTQTSGGPRPPAAASGGPAHAHDETPNRRLRASTHGRRSTLRLRPGRNRSRSTCPTRCCRRVGQSPLRLARSSAPPGSSPTGAATVSGVQAEITRPLAQVPARSWCWSPEPSTPRARSCACVRDLIRAAGLPVGVGRSVDQRRALGAEIPAHRCRRSSARGGRCLLRRPWPVGHGDGGCLRELARTPARCGGDHFGRRLRRLPRSSPPPCAACRSACRRS